MRRRLRHALLWMLFAGAVAVGASRWLANLGGGTEVTEISDSARARPVFVFQDGQWIAFRIPSTATRVKLLSRAFLEGDEEGLVDKDFPYTIEFRLESLTGGVVSEGVFGLQTKFIPMQNDDGKTERAATFRADDLIAASAKTSTLDLGADEVLILKLRAPELAAPIAGVSVRAFLRQRVAERKLDYLWSRLSEVSRTRIGRPRIHGLVDLTAAEQRASLENRWTPAGPQGVAGRDYIERTLYLRDDLVPANRQLVDPLGIGEVRCGQKRRAILPIPAPGGRVRLEFRRVEDGSPASAQIRFFGETLQQRSTHEHRLDAGISEFSGDFTAGMLEVESAVDVAIRPYLTAEGTGEQMLEFDPTIVRNWRVGGEEVLEFAIGGDRSEGGYFRVNARPLVGSMANLRFEFLAADGRMLRGAEHEIAVEPSHYDAMLTPDGDVPVNDPIDLVLDLPAGVATIRFGADAAVLLSGYTRPTSLTHRTRVPTDYQRALPDPDRLPIWFGLRPTGADDLIRAHRSHLIHTQVRPPEDDADILAGKYQWQDFQPVEGALGQYLLSDRDPESPSRDEALPSLFMPVSIGVEEPLFLESPDGFDAPSRRLVFVRDGQEPETLRVLVDGAVLFERQLVSGRGELLLPPIKADSRSVRIECAARNLRCFLNYVQPHKATKLKRLAQRVSPGATLVYQCEKATAEDELLTGMLFTPTGNDADAEIRVAIGAGEGGGFLPEAESFTLRERVYSVAPDHGNQTPVLGGNIPSVDRGRRFFIPFGSDLKAGTYEVSITLARGVEGYLTLSKVTGGDYSDARFFREASR